MLHASFCAITLAALAVAAPQLAGDATLNNSSEIINVAPASAVEAAGLNYHGSLRDTWSAPHWILYGPAHHVFGHRMGLNMVFLANETCNDQHVPGYQFINGSNPVGNATIGQIKDDVDSHTVDEWRSSSIDGFNDLYRKALGVTERVCAWPEANVGRKLQQLRFTGRWTISTVGGGTIGILYSIEQLAQVSDPVNLFLLCV